MPKPFKVARFPEEQDSLAIVPSSWVTADGQVCLWPPTVKEAHRLSLPRKKPSPTRERLGQVPNCGDGKVQLGRTCSPATAVCYAVDFWTQLRSNFRLARSACYELIKQFEASEFYPSDRNHGGVPVKTPEEHILSFLWYAVNKASMREVAVLFDMAESTQFADD
ncbi:hypothetical protein HPB50_018738 [Hyalomma asiaticum]|uniref:Uncharacterized protein n=1 Tax=Hyalomma asiaticum TaxID=266040 RepID=A0ACB7RYJ6_HYAAI|nr:hypothetical protein HPB50_018738 [Hyalomma asiaticum]